jgi:type II restriction/modification system DNA methylase subunit YeeA
MHGSFAVAEEYAKELLNEPNVHGRPNSDVIRTWANAFTVTKRQSNLWIIDVPPEVSEQAASYYEAPFEYLKNEVYPERQKNRRPMRKKNWWILGDPQKSMRKAIDGLLRFVLTPRVSKHRLFIWSAPPLLPTDATVAFARDDDYFLGVLHSRVHETWARNIGTQLREAESGFRYGPSTCFETFPFPEPTAAQRDAIAAAAKELDDLRNNWLNPPEWTKTEVLEFPGSVDGPWKRYVHDANAKGIGTVRYPRLVAKDADSAVNLKKRTLTNLYNERPAWLANAHKRLDDAVFGAYGWPADLSEDELLAKLLALNLERATAQ